MMDDKWGIEDSIVKKVGLRTVIVETKLEQKEDGLWGIQEVIWV